MALGRLVGCSVDFHQFYFIGGFIMTGTEIMFAINSIWGFYFFSIWTNKDSYNVTLKMLFLGFGVANLLFAIGKLPF